VARLDDRFAARWPLYALGDQFIFELVREPARSA
jgi:hypothetical protein